MEATPDGFVISFDNEEAIVRFEFIEGGLLRITYDLKNKHWFGVAFGRAVIE